MAKTTRSKAAKPKPKAAKSKAAHIQAGYIDGYVFPIPKRNVKAYTKMAKEGAELWMKYGALGYLESMGDDMKNAWGMPIEKMAKAAKGETVGFAFILFKSRKHRDSVNAKVHKDMASQMTEEQMKKMKMPFDPKKAAYAGFKTIVSK